MPNKLLSVEASKAIIPLSCPVVDHAAETRDADVTCHVTCDVTYHEGKCNVHVRMPELAEQSRFLLQALRLCGWRATIRVHLDEGADVNRVLQYPVVGVGYCFL